MQERSTLSKEGKSTGKQKKQQVIELELKEPVSFKIFSPQEERYENKEVSGQILSFNEKGILLLTEDNPKEGSFINLSINFKELGSLDDILGKVKRVEESDENDFYVGVELYSKEQIRAEALSGLFPEKINSFEVMLKNKLTEYFYKEKEQLQKQNSDESKT